MRELNFYQQQSIFSNPGNHVQHYQILPDNLEQLRALTQGLLLHFADNAVISQNRMMELDYRYVSAILRQLLAVNSTELAQERDPKERVISCCRDFALLLCSILRYQNIPARVRFGFSTFHLPLFHHDLSMLEYWHEPTETWRLVDVRTNEIFVKRLNLKIDFDIYDAPEYAFMTAGQAWKLCRQNRKSASVFGTGLLQRISGWYFIRNKLLQDFASLNGYEMLSWDVWGMMLQSDGDAFMQDKEQVDLLDEVADLIDTKNPDFGSVRRLYQSEQGVQVPEKIHSYSPAHGLQVVHILLQ